MKQLYTIARTALLGLALVSLLGCEYEEEQPEPNIPYYQFTADDRQWLSPQVGDTWVLETATGKQQRYQVENITESLHNGYTLSSYGINLGSQQVLYYYDRAHIEIKRLDSLQYNTLYFERSLPTDASHDTPPPGNGEFKLHGPWRIYGGSYWGLRGSLNPTPYQLQNRITLEVKGRTYTDVVVMHADNLPGAVLGKTYIITLYYAQREGVVRMVSSTGEIWNRVP